MKARLPIFSCNLALALIANVQCINVLYYSCKCRLFYFFPNYLLLNFGKLFSGRYIRCSAQSIDAQQNSHFQSCKNTNSESGLIIDNQRITRCAPTSPFSTIFHVTVLWSIPHQSYPPYFTPPFPTIFHIKRSPPHSTSKLSTTFHIKVIHHIQHHRSTPYFNINVLHHISHHRSLEHSTSPFSGAFHITVLWSIPRQSSPPHSTSNVLQSAKI